MLAPVVVKQNDVHVSKIKKPFGLEGLCIEKAKDLLNLALVVLVTAAEFINATCGIYKFNFACVERMRRRRNLQLCQRIFISIGPNNSFFGIDARLGNEGRFVGHVFENNQTII
jgi:hypothetical protein